MTNEIRPPHELQEPFFKLLGDELIALTPDHWRLIKLSITHVEQPSSAGRQLECAITSPEGYTEEVIPSEQLLETVRELDDLFRSHGAGFRAAVCNVREEAPDSWRVVIDYQR